jgi:regulator of replication initiation timing
MKMIEMIAVEECKKVVRELKQKNKNLQQENKKLKHQLKQEGIAPMELIK